MMKYDVFEMSAMNIQVVMRMKSQYSAARYSVHINDALPHKWKLWLWQSQVA